MLKPHPCRNSRSTGTDTIPASGRAPQLLAGKARSPGFAPRRPGYARPKHRIKSRSATKPETPRKHQGAEKPETPRSSRSTGTDTVPASGRTAKPEKPRKNQGAEKAGTPSRQPECRKPEPQAGIYRRRVGSMAAARPWSEPPTVQPPNRPQQVTAALSAPKYIQPPRRRTARRNRRQAVPGHNRVRARPCRAP